MNIDRNGIISLLRKDCVTCNVSLRKHLKTRCDPCHFSPKSGDRKSNANFIPLGATPKAIFKKYGIENPGELGKTRLYYFLYHPELNFKYPPIPQFDIFGNPTDEKAQWLIHHMNKNNCDDSPWNIILCLRKNEHSYFEMWDNKFKSTIDLLLS